MHKHTHLKTQDTENNWGTEKTLTIYGKNGFNEITQLYGVPAAP